jgi:hypothetical protein
MGRVITVNALVAKEPEGKSHHVHLLNGSMKRVCRCRIDKADFFEVEGAKLQRDEVTQELYLNKAGDLLMPTIDLCVKSYSEMYKELTKLNDWTQQ